MTTSNIKSVLVVGEPAEPTLVLLLFRARPGRQYPGCQNHLAVSRANEKELAALGLCSHIHKKGQRNKPLSKAQQRANTRKSRARVRVELVFGSMTNEQGGLYFRVLGLARTAMKIGLMNLVYNMRRLVQIDKLRASGV